MAKILVLSGSRADLGYLLPLARSLRDAGEDCWVETLENVIGGDDTPQAIAQRAGMILSAGGKTLADSKPDLMVVCGDRWEIASACIAAVLARVPIIQLAAGEVTTGAYDDKFRWAISEMATMLFSFTKEADQCCLSACMPSTLAGCTSVKRPDVISPPDGTAIVCLYPETAGDLPYSLATDILPLLEKRGLDPLLIGSNADVGSNHYQGVTLPLEEFHARLAKASLIIGNSSAGIIEAPILGTPTVDIGQRQAGRPRAASVFHCSGFAFEDIERAIDAALAFGKQRVESPYWNPDAVEIIVKGIRDYLRDSGDWS